MAHVVVEVDFERPLTDEESRNMARRIDECIGARMGHWVRSYVASDGLRMVCQFEAPDAESVREAWRSAKAPFTRVWAADLYTKE
jgi:hypothetical protein